MAQPNNIYKNSYRALSYQGHDVVNTLEEAELIRNEAIGKYDVVRIKRFKSGAKPNKLNNFKQSYQYSIWYYNK